jgi:tRNA(fMet)-specific endonuclease VapC
MIRRALLDSDVLSALMKRDAVAVLRAREYLAQHSQLSFSTITRFEILRGLKAKQATSQVGRFELFCGACEILSITDAIVDRAADIYAELHRVGKLIGDADILIAATALDARLDLVSNNASHFGRVAGLNVISWTG